MRPFFTKCSGWIVSRLFVGSHRLKGLWGEGRFPAWGVGALPGAEGSCQSAGPGKVGRVTAGAAPGEDATSEGTPPACSEHPPTLDHSIPAAGEHPPTLDHRSPAASEHLPALDHCSPAAGAALKFCSPHSGSRGILRSAWSPQSGSRATRFGARSPQSGCRGALPGVCSRHSGSRGILRGAWSQQSGSRGAGSVFGVVPRWPALGELGLRRRTAWCCGPKRRARGPGRWHRFDQEATNSR